MSLNSGTCWDILNISSTDDKKIIKRAYHELLRDNKPDEKPDEFKILYQAYQDALDTDSYSYYEAIEEPATTIEHVTISTEITPLETLNSAIYEDRVPSCELFNARVDALTYDNDSIEVFNNLNNWKFIKEPEFSEDLNYHKQYAKYLFDAINYMDKKFDNYLLSDKVIIYLNNIYLWNKNWKEYYSGSALFEYLQNNKVSNLITPKYLTLKIKLYSILIDTLIVIIISVLFTESLNMDPEPIAVYYFLFYGLLFVWFGVKTPGQYILKLKVLEQYGHKVTKISYAGAVVRLLLTSISIFTTLYFLHNPLSIAALFVLLNIYLLYTKRLLLQDIWGTRPYLIEK